MHRRHFIAGAGAIAMLSACATGALAQGSTTGYPADYQNIIEASKNENTVLIYQNMNSDVWSEVVKGFNAKYPWIDVQTLDLEASEVMERYLAERGSGRPSADLLVTVAPDLWIGLQEKGLIMPYESPEGAAYEEWSKPFPGLYTMTTDPIIFLYNKALLPEELVPTGMADLVEKAKANPEVFDGKITTYAANLNTFGYTIQYAMQKHHGDKLWEWYEVLGPMTKPERGAGPMAEKVAAGEYVLAYLTGSASSWVATRAPGADQILAWKFPEDGTPIVPRAMAIPVDAPHPNAAKLMLDFILSREGQMAFAAKNRTVVRPDVKSADVGGEYTYASVSEEMGADKMANVPYEADIATGYDEFTRRWREAFGE